MMTECTSIEQLRHKDADDMSEEELLAVMAYSIQNEPIATQSHRVAKAILNTITENATLRQQLQQVQDIVKDLANDAVKVDWSEVYKVQIDDLKQQLQQAQADNAAMRNRVKQAFYITTHNSKLSMKKTTEVHSWLREALESTTAGGELLAKMEQQDQTILAMRNCRNCEHSAFDSYYNELICSLVNVVGYKPFKKNLVCLRNELKDWQLAERLRGEQDG